MDYSPVELNVSVNVSVNLNRPVSTWRTAEWDELERREGDRSGEGDGEGEGDPDRDENLPWWLNRYPWPTHSPLAKPPTAPPALTLATGNPCDRCVMMLKG